MFSRVAMISPSIQRRPPLEKPSNGYPPFHHGSRLSSSATLSHWSRPSAMLIQLTRLSSNSRLLRKYSPYRIKSRSSRIMVTVAFRWRIGWPPSQTGCCRDSTWRRTRTSSTGTLILHWFAHLPSNTNSWRRCTRLSQMSWSRRPSPRLNAPSWLASAVIITLLFDDGSIWFEYPRMSSTDCVVWK